MPGCITRPARCGPATASPAGACSTRSATSHGVPHAKCGKLIVATNELEQAKIEGIYQQGIANGVEGLTFLTALRRRRSSRTSPAPAPSCRPRPASSTAMPSCWRSQGDLEDAGGVIAFHAPVERHRPGRAGLGGAGGRRGPDGARRRCGGQRRRPRRAGAGPRDARAIRRSGCRRLVLAKGNYFGCLGRPAFSRLIYPAPVDGGLGTHVTLDLAGRMRFGPDVEWIERGGLRGRPRAGGELLCLDPPLLARACRTARWCRIMPASGPKLTGPGEQAADFMIDGPAEHGLPGLVHLFGIESPGLTSCLSLAEDVADGYGCPTSPGRTPASTSRKVGISTAPDQSM